MTICARCKANASAVLNVLIRAEGLELIEPVCGECASAFYTRTREWLGKDKPTPSTRRQTKGWP